MTYWDRIREFGILSSIGTNKEQRSNMLKKEAGLLGAISIPIGLVLSLGISKLIIEVVNRLIANVSIGQHDFFMLNMNHLRPLYLIDNTIDLYMEIPIFVILVAILIVYVIIFISSMLPMRKINKMSQIEAIRNNMNSNINRKQVKTPKFIRKDF